MAMRSEKSGEYGERVFIGLHLGIYLTFGSDLGRAACGMIAWFGPGWITFYEGEKKKDVGGSLESRLRLP